jgi:hypothetical protein
MKVSSVNMLVPIVVTFDDGKSDILYLDYTNMEIHAQTIELTDEIKKEIFSMCLPGVPAMNTGEMQSKAKKVYNEVLGGKS